MVPVGCRVTERGRGCEADAKSVSRPRNVIENTERKFVEINLALRLPIERPVDLNLAGGVLLEGLLKGAVLVEGADGHLVRDNERSYEYELDRGLYARGSISVSARWFSQNWRFDVLPAVQLQYEYSYTRFGPVEERGHFFFLGLGYKVYAR